MKNVILTSLLSGLFLIACQNNKQTTGIENYKVNFEGLLDTLLPRFAKLHDSIPNAEKFAEKNKHYMQVHKKERDYKWLNYCENSNGYTYFMVSRLEPSIKRDKYSAICGKFKRNEMGQFDSASYEELFWTWKMRVPELEKKADKLFETVLEDKPLEPYLPGHSKDEWVEFPGNGVVYDKATQTWQQTGAK